MSLPRCKLERKKNMYLINKCRQDNLPYVHSQIKLKLQAPFTIRQQVLCKPRPILPETHIGWILTLSPEPILEHLALAILELASQITDVVAMVVAAKLKDTPCLEEYLEQKVSTYISQRYIADEHKHTNIHIEALEPFPELFILVCIINQHVGSIEDYIQALPVGKAFKKHSELGRDSFQTGVLHEMI
jgi:hypothetical protein